MYILIDIGGTNTRIAGSSDKQTFGEPVIFPTPQNFDEWLKQAKEIINSIKGDDAIQAIVAGLAGTFSHDRTSVHVCPHLPLWNGINLKKHLAEPFSTDLYLENDTAIVGLGEAVYGSGKGHDIVVYITISTGVGGVRVIDGSIDRNKFGFEIGHHIVNDGKDIEYYIGGASHEKRFGMPSKDIHDPEFWKEVDYYIGIFLANTTMYWSPSVIVLGGPVVNDINLERALETTKEYTKIYEDIPLVVKSSLGALGGIYGGLATIQKLNKDF